MQRMANFQTKKLLINLTIFYDVLVVVLYFVKLTFFLTKEPKKIIPKIAIKAVLKIFKQ